MKTISRLFWFVLISTFIFGIFLFADPYLKEPVIPRTISYYEVKYQHKHYLRTTLISFGKTKEESISEVREYANSATKHYRILSIKPKREDDYWICRMRVDYDMDKMNEERVFDQFFEEYKEKMLKD